VAQPAHPVVAPVRLGLARVRSAWEDGGQRVASCDLDKLDPRPTRRILRFLSERVAKLDDPRSIGEALKGSELGEFWKYRVGDFRIIAAIEDARLLIIGVRVGNRREIT
jgi:mRNA interferase RelE/StbE